MFKFAPGFISWKAQVETISYQVKKVFKCGRHQVPHKVLFVAIKGFRLTVLGN